MAELKYDLYPNPYQREEIQEYIERGRPLGNGSFLEAVVCNDLKGACTRADDTNKYMIWHIVGWFYNHAPFNCWGSKERYKEWVEMGGLGIPIPQEQSTET